MKRLIYTVICLLFFATLSSAQVAVIANNSISESSISKDALAKIYALDMTKWSNGESVIAFGYKTEDVTVKAFYGYLGKSKKAYRKIWMKKMLSGDGQAPDALGSEDEILQKVASTPGAIGFVSAAKASGGGVKILLEIK